MPIPAGDGDGKAATVGDLRRMLQEQAEHQKAEIATVHETLKKLVFELKRGASLKTGADPGSIAGALNEQVPFSEPVDQEFEGALGLNATASELPVPVEGGSGDGDGGGHGKKAGAASHAHGTSHLKDVGFSIAKAFGFDSVASLRGHEKSDEAALQAADEPHISKSGRSASHKSFISRQAAMSARERLSLLQRFVHSAVFENLTGAIVFANAIVIGAHANLRALHPERCANWEPIFYIFHVVFTLELVTRICVYRRDFLFGPDHRWNIFDSVIVLAGLLEELIKAVLGDTECSSESSDSNSSIVSGITVLRILRVLRVVRIIKAFRTMTIFRDLRIMVASTLGCLVPLGWACLLLFFIMWCFSVYFLYLSTDYVAQAIREFGIEVLDDDTKPYKELRTFFGSLWLSIYTLFQTITAGGDWGPPADVLYRVTGQIHPVILMMGFIALTVFAVLNVITGVFVENATKIAMQDRELVIQDALSNRDHYKEDVLAVFREADADGSGQLSVNEFELHLKDPRVQAFLESLELDGMGATRMFRLLDLDGNGWVSATEFVTGCMCLKGDAKTMDVAALLLEVNKMSSSLFKSMARLEGRLNAVSSSPRLLEAMAPASTAHV